MVAKKATKKVTKKPVKNTKKKEFLVEMTAYGMMIANWHSKIAEVHSAYERMKKGSEEAIAAIKSKESELDHLEAAITKLQGEVSKRDNKTLRIVINDTRVKRTNLKSALSGLKNNTDKRLEGVATLSKNFTKDVDYFDSVVEWHCGVTYEELKNISKFTNGTHSSLLVEDRLGKNALASLFKEVE